jgi:hypothetical protein
MVKLSGSSADPGRIWAREMAAAAACSELQLRELKNPAVRLLQAVQRYTDNLQVAATTSRWRPNSASDSRPFRRSTAEPTMSSLPHR